MTGNDAVLALVVLTALGFDFTNGFHDTGNAMATSIVTGALPPRVAVAVSAVLNLAGAFLSTEVAATIASGLVNSHVVTLTVVFAGLTGAILWNLATWFLGIPSSSSHALIGGVIGATMAAAGGSAVKWQGVVSKVIVPAALSPFIAGAIAALGTWLVYRLTRQVAERPRAHGFRIGQVGSASMVSLAHGTNDAQKTMGIITLALIANGTLHSGAKSPDWVIASCAVAIALGTYIGGWRVIRALGKGLVEIEPAQGLASESASAAVILASTDFGYSLSTTHVATGSILGAGVGKKGAEVRWHIARRMVMAWLLTLPAAALVGAVAYWAAHGIGGTAGVVVIFIVLVLASIAFFVASRHPAVTPENVNAAWTGTVVPAPTTDEAAS
ncbi:inorganic phosphate transporter [Kitasatospora sp. NBC_01250]|uniref:inorganic phosphate transporter n=1 Tax=unclassified Kitasatospora TaxID=2633591 RepID=UPI002E12427E|nr:MULTISPECIES: anion permease [unclassified Kitasatospora]WSJ65246.1 inorganic phosphate transporter [Kitasatospora sp. NBC_01302]